MKSYGQFEAVRGRGEAVQVRPCDCELGEMIRYDTIRFSSPMSKTTLPSGLAKCRVDTKPANADSSRVRTLATRRRVFYVTNYEQLEAELDDAVLFVVFVSLDSDR